jgi:hypothetical protein
MDAPYKAHHQPGYLEVRRVPTVETQGPGLGCDAVNMRSSSGSRIGKRETCTSFAAHS